MASRPPRALLATALVIAAGTAFSHSFVHSKVLAIGRRQVEAVLPIVNPPQPQTSIVISLGDYMTQGGHPVSAYQALKQALTACQVQKAAKLVIPAGRYVFDDPAIQLENVVHAGVFGQRDLIIDGQGSEFIFHYPNYGFGFSGSQRVLIRNLIVDWDISLASPGIVQKEPDGRTSIRIPDGYPASEATAFEAVSLYDIQNFKWKKDGFKEVYHPQGVSLLRPQTFVSSDFSLFADGDTVVIRHYLNEGNAFAIGLGCSDITLEDVTVYSCPGMAFGAFSADRGFRLSRCKLLLRPGAHRLISATADGSHFSHTRGDIIVENCDFSGQGDDSLNITGLWLAIARISGPRTLVVGDPQSGYSGGPRASYTLIEAGDTLKLCEPANLAEYGRFRVTQVSYDATAAAYTLIVDQDIPSSATVGDLVGNLDRGSPRYLVRSNFFHDHRARGMLIQAGPGLIENNRVQDVTFAGIHLTVDDHTFFEGFGCDSVTLQNNVFEGCNYSGEIGPYGRHMACVNLLGDVSPGISSSPVHRNVVIQGNSIIDTPGLAILVASSKDVSVLGNLIENANLRPFSLYHTGSAIDATASGTIMVTRASNVRVAGNCLAETSPEKGVYLDARNTSGVVVQDECWRMPVYPINPPPVQHPIALPAR